MKKLIAVIAVLLLLVDCTAIQNAADSIQRNFKLQQLEVRAITEGQFNT